MRNLKLRSYPTVRNDVIFLDETVARTGLKNTS
jgi:hypothetical protein